MGKRIHKRSWVGAQWGNTSIRGAGLGHCGNTSIRGAGWSESALFATFNNGHWYRYCIFLVQNRKIGKISRAVFFPLPNTLNFRKYLFDSAGPTRLRSAARKRNAAFAELPAYTARQECCRCLLSIRHGVLIDSKNLF